MITVHYAPSPNVFKVLIALEELSLEYQRRPINLRRGEQFEPAFLVVGPNNRVPVIIDDEPADGGDPLAVFESGAILLYLAEKAGALMPTELRGRTDAMAWLMWQMAGQGPMLGQLGHFRNYAPETLAYPIERYANEGRRLYGVLDRRMHGRRFVAGEAFSIADIACWPWLLFRSQHGIDLEPYPDLARWFQDIGSRPAVQRALEGFVVPPPPKFDEEARRNLFGPASGVSR